MPLGRAMALNAPPPPPPMDPPVLVALLVMEPGRAPLTSSGANGRHKRRVTSRKLSSVVTFLALGMLLSAEY